MKLENDIAQHLEQGEFLALATIIDRSGSAPRHAGAQMLVTRDLSVIGTIGGGQVESDVLAACLPVRKGGTARLMHFDMTGFTPDADMICGGIVDILVERITPEQLPFFRQSLPVQFFSCEPGRHICSRFCTVNTKYLAKTAFLRLMTGNRHHGSMLSSCCIKAVHRIC